MNNLTQNNNKVKITKTVVNIGWGSLHYYIVCEGVQMNPVKRGGFQKPSKLIK